jgi:hypothetical protein
MDTGVVISDRLNSIPLFTGDTTGKRQNVATKLIKTQLYIACRYKVSQLLEALSYNSESHRFKIL